MRLDAEADFSERSAILCAYSSAGPKSALCSLRSAYVTREQLATMLWRYAGEPASTYSLGAYTDADSVSSWAETAMRWAVENGIITGVTESTLVPQGTATRAQCAAMLMRFAEL